jgi:hypothetical protein
MTTTCATPQQRCPKPVDTFTVHPFDLQTLLIWERRKPKHLRNYQVLWAFNITETGTSQTFLPNNETPTVSNVGAVF